ncbi:MAG: Amidohydrolase [Herbaspirillum sp.]|jgi:dihydroorotase|nr:Amidohydrolase [Herbaspirillum sp.]
MTTTSFSSDAVFDVIIEGGHVIDPASGLDEPADVAVRDGRIAAIAKASDGGLSAIDAARRINAAGKLVCPGLIDIHVHVFEYVTNFGVAADDAGVGVGATTIVDAGSSGPWTFGGFKHFVIDKASTDVRAFVSINGAGALMGGMKGDILHSPDMTDAAALLAVIGRHPDEIRGIKCHGESGALSHWGTKVLASAAEAGRAAQVPLYVHTGELFPVIEASRPSPRSVLEQVLPLLKEGDILAHIYSNMPDGIVGEDEKTPSFIRQALDKGVHFDIGYGINFSYRIARMLMAEGIYPYTISSDAHGDFSSYHDNSKLNYSLPGAMSRLLALGMPLVEVIRATTVHPAAAIGLSDDIGRLAVGRRADISILELREEPWRLLDGRFNKLNVDSRLIPWLTLRAGVAHQPRPAMMPDLLDASLPDIWRVA